MKLKSKKLKTFDVSFEDKSKKTQNAVTTGYCTNETPFLKRKELNRKIDLNTSGGKLTKILLQGVRKTIQKKPKQQANLNVCSNNDNLGKNTLKTIGVSIGNFFKPIKRIGRKEPDSITIDPKDHITDIFFPDECKFRKNSKLPLDMLVTPTNSRTVDKKASEGISRTCQPRIVTTKTCSNLSSYPGLITRYTPPSQSLMCTSPRKKQPSMGVDAKVLKNLRTLKGTPSLMSLDSNDLNLGPSDLYDVSHSTNILASNNYCILDQTITKTSFKDDNRDIYENISFIEKFTTFDTTYIVDSKNGKTSQNDLDINVYSSFDKYLVRSIVDESSAENSPEMEYLNTSNATIRLMNPTPFVKFSTQSRYQKLKNRSAESSSSSLKLKSLDSLVDYEFNFDSYDSDL